MHAKWESEGSDLTKRFGLIEPKGPPRKQGEIADLECAMAMTYVYSNSKLDRILANLFLFSSFYKRFSNVSKTFS